MKTELEQAIEFYNNNTKEFEDALEAQGTIIDAWTAEDVKSVDENLTDEQVANVLSLMRHKRDATIGINWDVIRVWIDYVKEG